MVKGRDDSGLVQCGGSLQEVNRFEMFFNELENRMGFTH